MLLRYKRFRNFQECPTSICQISIPMRKINLINSSLFFYSRALCQLVLSTLYGSNLQPSLIKIYNYGILVKTRTLSGLSMLEKMCLLHPGRDHCSYQAIDVVSDKSCLFSRNEASDASSGSGLFFKIFLYDRNGFSLIDLLNFSEKISDEYALISSFIFVTTCNV